MRVKLTTIGVVLVAALSMGGCRRLAPPEWLPGQSGGHARYAGIGIYGPGKPWTRMVAAQHAKDTPAAKTIDDQAIIVVVDSITGEVRACGDLTGYCIGMNPWKAPLVSAQIAPINLTEHEKPNDPDLTVTVAPAESSAPAHTSKRAKGSGSEVAESSEHQ